MGETQHVRKLYVRICGCGFLKIRDRVLKTVPLKKGCADIDEIFLLFLHVNISSVKWRKATTLNETRQNKKPLVIYA